MLTRADIIDLVQNLRLQADIIEQTQDTQEFDEAIADIKAAIHKVAP